MDETPKPTESTDIPAGEPSPEPAPEPAPDTASEPAPEPAPEPQPQVEVPARDVARDASIVESLLLVADHPIPLEKIAQLLGGPTKGQVREAIEVLRAKHPPDASGIVVEEVARGFQLRTNPANQEFVRKFFDVKPARFSRASLETLAVVAYKQPVTRIEMEQIRQVDCAAALRTLMEKRLVKVVGKKNVPGKPFLFGTTREFLEVFGLARLEDLPSLRDIEEFLAARTGTPVPESPAPASVVEHALRDGSELSESLGAAGPAGAGDEGTSACAVPDDVLAEAAASEGVAEPAELPDASEPRSAAESPLPEPPAETPSGDASDPPAGDPDNAV